MRRVASPVGALVVALACSAPTARSSEPIAIAVEDAALPDLPTCAAGSETTPQLDSYYDAEVPGTYWVDMVFDPRRDRWKMARSMRMPDKYSTHLRITNLGRYSQLDRYRDHTMRFTVELASRKVDKIADQDRWLATYEARLLEVCSAVKR